MRLALIGKNIAHSYSPKIYQRLLGKQLNEYQLLDIETEEKLPVVQKLLLHFQGISVTSPYKQWAFSQSEVASRVAQHLQLANVLYRQNGILHADLTDFYAAKKILLREKKERGIKQVTILGDGAMAKMLTFLLPQLDIGYRQFSRRLGWADAENYSTYIINTCLKEAQFPFRLRKESVLWDFNYGYCSSLRQSSIDYIDGQELLYLQAEYFLALISRENSITKSEKFLIPSEKKL